MPLSSFYGLPDPAQPPPPTAPTPALSDPTIPAGSPTTQSGAAPTPSPTPSPTPTPAPTPAPAQQTQAQILQNYIDNYWAPDRYQVLAKMGYYDPQANQNGGIPQPVPTGPGFPTPATPSTPATGASSSGAPSYVNTNDPLQAAVWAAYQKKGITPRDQSDFQYWIDRINQTGGWSNPGNQSYWLARMAQAAGGVGDYSGAPEAGSGGSGTGSGSGGITSGGVFTDPATANWEALLNKAVGQLQTPFTPQDLGPLEEYMRSYFKQLQGPAYTPEQTDLIQTQAIDPLTRQRDQTRQQIIERFAAQGMGPSSGPVQQALADLDRAYASTSTTARSNFATQAIGLQKQQQQLATQIGASLTGLENSQQGSNEARLLQAVGLLGQIPQLADSRLALANQTLNSGGLNPISLLGLQNQLSAQQLQNSQYNTGQANTYGYQSALQQQQFMAQLAQLISGLFT